MSRVEIRLQRVTLSYPHLFEARSVNQGAPKYSASFLLRPATIPEHYEALTAINAGRAQVIAESGGKEPKRDLPLKNGETEYPGNELYAGVYIVRAASTGKPQTVDQNVNPVIDASSIYPGCVVNASITIYAYKHQTGGGITFGLEAVQLVGDGPRLDNRPDASTIFQPVDGGVVGSQGAESGKDFDWM